MTLAGREPARDLVQLTITRSLGKCCISWKVMLPVWSQVLKLRVNIAQLLGVNYILGCTLAFMWVTYTTCTLAVVAARLARYTWNLKVNVAPLVDIMML